ncbi:MAG: hypothetical protein ACRENA_01110 [Vulcanimicrobiaceae bacterium]
MEPNQFATVAAQAVGARDRLTALARLPERDEKRMAQIGESALFEEALLGALHAHLSEVRIVTHGI